MNSALVRGVVCVALSLPATSMPTDLSQTSVQVIGQDRSSLTPPALSETDRVRAEHWQLSVAEWQRYTRLMQGVRGSISPSTLSPIEVLGIHARDDDERRRYAEIWARTLYEDAGRVLAFQHAYDAAIRRLYPNQPLIDVSRIPGKAADPGPLQATDRLLLFTRPDCRTCGELIGALLQRLDDVAGIDIYLVGVAKGDDDAVRAWAVRHRIDPDWVRRRRVTLNHDGGALARLTEGEGTTPSLFRRRGETLSQLNLSDL